MEALRTAEGRSEFLIVVVADIRGFSEFSTRNESPNIAMFIKRFYLMLITNYFKTATFVKPTGDGLLMTFRYSETDLLTVGKLVMDGCMRCLADFPTLCAEDPMINFPVPVNIGFGIARGTACCLFSNNETLDYSGHLLNLASRLNDLARPSGIVIDSNFLSAVIPDSHRELFKTAKVYVRSIAETEPVEVLYLADKVHIPDDRLRPLSGDNWNTITRHYSVGALKSVSDSQIIALPGKIKIGKLRVIGYAPKPRMRLSRVITLAGVQYDEDGALPRVTINIKPLKEAAKAVKSPPKSVATVKVEYVLHNNASVADLGAAVKRSINKPKKPSKTA